jgi:hypothetical protein
MMCRAHSSSQGYAGIRSAKVYAGGKDVVARFVSWRQQIEPAGDLGFFQFLRNVRHRNAFEQAELILQAALDPAIASRARRGEFVTGFDSFDLLQTAIN